MSDVMYNNIVDAEKESAFPDISMAHHPNNLREHSEVVESENMIILSCPALAETTGKCWQSLP